MTDKEAEANAGGEASLQFAFTNLQSGYSGRNAFTAEMSVAVHDAMGYGPYPPSFTFNMQGTGLVTIRGPFTPPGVNHPIVIDMAQRFGQFFESLVAIAVTMREGNEAKANQAILGLLGGYTNEKQGMLAYATLRAAVLALAQNPQALFGELTLSGSVISSPSGARFLAYATETNQKLTRAFTAEGEPGKEGVTISEPTEPGPGQAPGAGTQSP